jgi:NTP pyrophosphatase (non-canonical NTP hydrolase)
MPLSDQSTPIAELREKLKRFADARDWGQFHVPKDLAAAIAIEAAELMELYLWQPRERDVGEPVQGERRARLEEEVADVAICLLNLCNALDLDLAAAVERKIALNDQKYPAERFRGRADKA